MTSAEHNAGAFDVGLLSPGTVGSDATVSDAAVCRAMVDAEVALLRALVAGGIAPASAAGALERAAASFVPDAASIALRSAGGGNPVIPLVADLRAAVRAAADPSGDAATWVHRGATSQDILDTALMLTASRARGTIMADLTAIAASLATLADAHRNTVMAGRTLTQHSTPITFGVKAAGWLSGVLDARDGLAAVALPAQLAGASGTLASFVELSDAATAAALPAAVAAQLGLAAPRHPWHTSRASVTALGDAFLTVTDALGTLAANVSLLARPEFGELAEPAAEGRGVSSSMPQKQNPVLSVLIRSLAARAPFLAAQVHASAASAIDERPDGAWHAEWPALRELARLALGACSLARELVAGLEVDADRMRENLALTGESILAERVSLGGTAGRPEDYLGLCGLIIDEAIERSRA